LPARPLGVLGAAKAPAGIVAARIDAALVGRAAADRSTRVAVGIAHVPRVATGPVCFVSAGVTITLAIVVAGIATAAARVPVRVARRLARPFVETAVTACSTGVARRIATVVTVVAP
jgi:hypothetical protein